MLGLVLLNPLVVVAVTAGSLAAGHALGWHVFPGELLLAAGVGIVSPLLALLPLYFVRHSAPRWAVAQAAFLATVIHLFSTIVLAAAVFLIFHPAAAFAYWMLVMYWTTLISLSLVLIKAVRSHSQSVSPTPPKTSFELRS